MTHTARVLIVLAIVAGVLFTPPVTASGPNDPLTCAEKLEDPELRPTVWRNVTEAREWGLNATVWGLRTVNATFSTEAGNGSANTTPPPPPEMNPSNVTATAIDHAVEHPMNATAETHRCLRRSLGTNDTVNTLSEEVGHVVATIADAAGPYRDHVEETVRDAECSIHEEIGNRPEHCPSEEDPSDP